MLRTSPLPMETAHFNDIGPTDGQCVLCAAQRAWEELKAFARPQNEPDQDLI